MLEPLDYEAVGLISGLEVHQQLLTKHHFNQEGARYELHRMWVVEATVRPGVKHIYSKVTDGTSVTTESPGAPYPDLDVSHVYGTTGKVVFTGLLDKVLAELFDDGLDGRYAGVWLMNESVTLGGELDRTRTPDTSANARTYRSASLRLPRKAIARRSRSRLRRRTA